MPTMSPRQLLRMRDRNEGLSTRPEWMGSIPQSASAQRTAGQKNLCGISLHRARAIRMQNIAHPLRLRGTHAETRATSRHATKAGPLPIPSAQAECSLN